ncbi:2-phospho-L-lactate guanylyltransferase [Vibrio hippocampi]|uniref:Phosphoenolpyruvate guanylyltransferase n=1 Tax=Vibrio hippocampi TaxID=654686 RepID=A0ABM8ZMX0_9VIBR|nr:2-phospho-L-lactate guanylyltransferase [Vibrio hippocampi]CAH0529137.1 Phosphoenolpyruvate guanylyltransferase [Vibrio hippocampi]
MQQTLNIVIPMKAPIRAKQRLMDVLSVTQRRQLAVNLYRETLSFFARHYPDIHCLVVTDSREIANIAAHYGASALLENQSTGLNAAIESATEWSIAAGYQCQMVVPADIATLDCDEFDALFHALKSGHQVVIARAKDSGTNALLTSPPDAIDFQYGRQSALAHAQQAHANQLTVEVLDLPELSQDIDLPEDLFRSYPAYQQRECCYE